MSDDAEHAPAAADSTSATPDRAARSRKGKRRGRAKARHTVAKVVWPAWSRVGMATGLGVVYLYRHLNDNLNVGQRRRASSRTARTSRRSTPAPRSRSTSW